MNSAKRGRAWEEIVERSFGCLPQCTVTRISPPVRVVRWPGARKGRRNAGEFIGYFETKGTCDFEGGYQGRVVSIDAKRTKSKRWSLSMIKPHQLDHIFATTGDHRGLAGVVLAWDCDDGETAAYGIGASALDDLINVLKQKSISREYLEDVISVNQPNHCCVVQRLPYRPTREGVTVGLEKWLDHLRHYADTGKGEE